MPVLEITLAKVKVKSIEISTFSSGNTSSIKVTDRIAPGTTPLVKVKDEIKFYLETQEQLKVLKNLTTGLMKSAKIEYIDPSFKPKTEVSKKALENIKD